MSFALQLLARFMSTMGASDNPLGGLALGQPGSRVGSARHPKKKPSRMPVNMWQTRLFRLELRQPVEGEFFMWHERLRQLEAEGQDWVAPVEPEAQAVVQVQCEK